MNDIILYMQLRSTHSHRFVSVVAMDMALLKSRSSKLHGTPNSAMKLELSPLVTSCSFAWTARVVKFGNFCPVRQMISLLFKNRINAAHKFLRNTFSSESILVG